MRSWKKTLTAFLLVIVALTASIVPAASSAVELLPAGTTIAKPDEAGIVLDVPKFLFSRGDTETISVMDSDLQVCRRDLAACERVVVQTPQNTSQAWIIGGFAVSVSAAFAAGMILALETK